MLIPFWNVLLAYICYFVCRIVFLWQNWKICGGEIEDLNIRDAFCGSLVFDTSAICFTLGPYLLLMLLPLPVRNRKWYQTACKIYFIVICAVCILMNLADSVYFPYAERRTTPSTFMEFGNEGFSRLFGIIAMETVRNWYLVLLAAAMTVGLCLLYKKGNERKKLQRRSTEISLRCMEVLVWLVTIALLVAGMRGGFTRQTRPINIGNAMRYVNTPARAAVILNTPFSMIKNISETGYARAGYFPQGEHDKYYSALHKACKGSWSGETKPNVVIIVVESLSQEFIGAYNDYPCNTPFIDSLRSVGLSPREAFANGNKSIDALPSILSSVPRMEEHIVLTPYANNRFCSVVSELAFQGYSNAFFHGSSPGSMGFDAFASSAGVRKFYSLEDYSRDTRFNGSKDFDGTWAIWDEEFLQYAALHMDDLKEPFISTIYTASSHHPFKVPEKYRDVFNGKGHPMSNCVGYVDYSLKRFFRTAAAQPWYQNTIFVLTADHTSSVSEQKSYLQDGLGAYRIPVIIFDPSGRLPARVIDTVSQQTDIFPTIMGIIGAERDYFAFGKDILDDLSGNWAYIYKEIHCMKKTGVSFLFDGERLTEADGNPEKEDIMFLKAFIQEYKDRMIDNNFIERR